jgi:23S rRNA pseudouridine1911/1915/1917 synthase
LRIEFVADKDCIQRIDKILTRKVPQLTRTKIQLFLKSGKIKVNDKAVKPSYKLKQGDVVKVEVEESPNEVPLKSNIPLNIIYEDGDLIVVNKDSGIVSHPAGRHRENTLLQGVYFYLDKKGELSSLITPLFKPTLVHRLDKETSGIIIIAKTIEAYYNLQKQFMHRTIYKEYWAIVEGRVNFDSDLIDKKIIKSKKQFAKMTVSTICGKESQTIYKVLERFKDFTLISAVPKTGRTHQIRIHLASIGYPIVCDKVYGYRSLLYEWQIMGIKVPTQELMSFPPLLSRQALHAKKLSFLHPKKNEVVTLETNLPVDLENTLTSLRKYQKI